MKFITVYRTLDRTEISIVKHQFEQEEINYHVTGEATNDSAGVAGLGGGGMTVQVREDQVEKAKQILAENGFLGEFKKFETTGRKKSSVNKGVIIFLALLVVILAVFLVVWFMNVE